MSYPHGIPVRTRSISEIYQGRLHNYNPMYHPPYNPYRQYTGILRFLRHHLENPNSAEQRPLRSSAENKTADKKLEIKIGKDTERQSRLKDEDILEIARRNKQLEARLRKYWKGADVLERSEKDG